VIDQGMLASWTSQAADWDRVQQLPDTVITDLAALGGLGAAVPAKHGGSDVGLRAFGELCAELGRVCTSLRSLVTVQSMVADALARWGTDDQRGQWLPALTTGTVIAGLAATEVSAGSDLAGVQTSIEPVAGGFRLTGKKTWVTFGARANVFLVLGSMRGTHAALLVERDRAGVAVEPVVGQLGLRAAMLADIVLDGVIVPSENLLGRQGFGLSAVVGHALGLGRYSVAWGCLGMVEASLERSIGHATTRHQFGAVLAEHQLVRALISDMMVGARTVRLLCQEAGELLEQGAADSSTVTMMAKYHAARTAADVTRDAVQIQGASACASGSLAERFFRDAKIMQLIEGSDQMSQLTICDAGFRRRARRSAP